MIQIWALAVDAYRELASKRLFWLVLFLSILVAAAFAGVGINAQGFSLMGKQIDNDLVNSSNISPLEFYKNAFARFAVPIWLAWIAGILALVSTASIFPDFIAGGAIEMTLSKPIGRLRLFLTKYIFSLLFVTLQVFAFTAACFLTIGIRGGEWIPKLFIAVPIVVLMYSFLYCVCVLAGVLTRSAIASLLLSMLFWFVLFILNSVDGVLLQFKEYNTVMRERIERRISDFETPPKPGEPSPVERNEAAAAKVKDLKSKLAEAEKSGQTMRFFSNVVFGIKTVLPKTSETVGLLERSLTEAIHMPAGSAQSGGDDLLEGNMSRMSEGTQREIAERTQAALRARSVAWVLGTSVAFEVVVLGIGGWIFSRRDF